MFQSSPESLESEVKRSSNIRWMCCRLGGFVPKRSSEFSSEAEESEDEGLSSGEGKRGGSDGGRSSNVTVSLRWMESPGCCCALHSCWRAVEATGRESSDTQTVLG